MATKANLIQPPTSSTSKKNVFVLIALWMPFVLFVLLELGLRMGGYSGDPKLFLKFQGYGGGELYRSNPNFAARYFLNAHLRSTPSRDRFLLEKPGNRLRLFVLGESTTAGYPCGFNGMFSRVLSDALIDVLSTNPIEVVNSATSAVNSYTVYDQIDVTIDHKPDGVMIYLGHNEFYGALGVASSERSDVWVLEGNYSKALEYANKMESINHVFLVFKA